MMNDELKTPGSDIHHSSFITHHLFSVRTPTAIVTDLGTEFGVEVGQSGNTTSHVFRGAVRMTMVAGRGRLQPTTILHENESARVEIVGGADGRRWVLRGVAGSAPVFARRLVEPPKLLDLLDVVAGGDGTGHRRESGIDPGTGSQDRIFATYHRSDPHYRPAFWQPLVDGVFIPDGRAGAVQLDTAGHAFAGFPPTTGVTYGSIWRGRRCARKTSARSPRSTGFMR